MTESSAEILSPPAALKAALAAEALLLLPCPYDALSARLAVEAGFKAMFMGGYASVASRFAFPDIGLASATEMLETARAVVRAAGPVPVICDGDTGYGGDANVRRTVQDLAAAGAAAVMIEDQTWPKRCGHLPGKDVVPRQEAVARIRAAVRAREETRDGILILARTDARGVLGLDEALARVRAFADEGADMLFMEAPQDEREMAAFTAVCNVPCLANMLEDGKTPILPPERLRELGFKMAAYPISLLGAAAAGVQEALANIAQGRPTERRVTHMELLRLTGFSTPVK
jgi:2-methylisocitrate lyase-like PEP mutase family enzyme